MDIVVGVKFLLLLLDYVSTLNVNNLLKSTVTVRVLPYFIMVICFHANMFDYLVLQGGWSAYTDTCRLDTWLFSTMQMQCFVFVCVFTACSDVSSFQYYQDCCMICYYTLNKLASLEIGSLWI